jgi:hypothetical protein
MRTLSLSSCGIEAELEQDNFRKTKPEHSDHRTLEIGPQVSFTGVTLRCLRGTTEASMGIDPLAGRPQPCVALLNWHGECWLAQASRPRNTAPAKNPSLTRQLDSPKLLVLVGWLIHNNIPLFSHMSHCMNAMRVFERSTDLLKGRRSVTGLIVSQFGLQPYARLRTRFEAVLKNLVLTWLCYLFSEPCNPSSSPAELLNPACQQVA